MLKLSINQSRRSVKLGTIVMLSVERADASVEARIFLRQGPVFYPRPLVDWSRPEEPILIFPESPGRYSVEAHWRRPDGATGRESLTFKVEAAETDDKTGPQRVQLQHFSLWVPSSFEARAFESQDQGVGDALARLVKPGQIVYDVGANVGYYAAHFARLVGTAGQVVCLEANPVCAYFLRANLIDLGLDQTWVLPAAALHVNGMTRFSVNYGNTNLGTAETSGFFHHKPGQEIAVGCFSLDHL
ncbi:MAG: FkbM family methyltransferase, partial [Acidobacteriota bacterium]